MADDADKAEKIKAAYKKYVLTLRGTKLLPRRQIYLKADTIRRNRFGDLICTLQGEVVASYNREMVIGIHRTNTELEPRKVKTKVKHTEESTVTGYDK